MASPISNTEMLQEADAAVIQAGDFRINCSTRTVILRGHELWLAGEEFELLFLISHPNKLATPPRS